MEEQCRFVMFLNLNIDSAIIVIKKVIKTVIFITVLIACAAANAQEYNNWLLIDGSILNFDTSPATLIPKDDADNTNFAQRYCNYTVALSDDDGKMILYGYFEINDDAKPNYVIKNADKQDVIRLTLVDDPCNIIGCKSPQGEYYIAVTYRTGFTNPVELHLYRFDPNGQLENEYVYQGADGYTFFIDFIQLKDFVALVAYRANHVETYKLTPDGCVLWNTSEITLDSHFTWRMTPYFDIEHSLDSEKIIAIVYGIGNVLYFNKNTGEVSISHRLENIKFKTMAFSKTDKFFLIIDEGLLKGFKYDKNFDFVLDSPDLVYDLSNYMASNVWEMATGIDGKLYVYQFLADYIIVLDGIESGTITQDVIKTGKLGYANFPQISRRIETPDCNASAAFDNAYVCHGQPLSIIPSGDAPFEISYTIDNEPHNITTSDTEYQLPDVVGRYKITKIKDASCEFFPMENNEAEIAPQMKKLRIVAE